MMIGELRSLGYRVERLTIPASNQRKNEDDLRPWLISAAA
jgi:hypothetical protein